MARKRTFPDWSNWELLFGIHVDSRMEERGVTELDVRAMLEKGLDSMTERSIQVTYRGGQVFAAYLYLARKTGEKSVRTVASSDGLLIVDYAADGHPLGVEITSPKAVTLDRLNQLLAELKESPLAEQEYSPVRAA